MNIADVLNNIYSLLKSRVNGVATHIQAIRFSDDKNFNFEQLGNKKGVRNFSLRNIGGYDLIIKDVNEIIPPGSTFSVIGNQRLVNTDFKVEFGTTLEDPSKPRKEAIARYTIDVC